MSARVLVVGGAGYIGSHTCLELLDAGYRVTVVDNLSNSKLESLNRVHQLSKSSKTVTPNLSSLKNPEDILTRLKEKDSKLGFRTYVQFFFNNKTNYFFALFNLMLLIIRNWKLINVFLFLSIKK
mgnify:CR=1 FL=1